MFTATKYRAYPTPAQASQLSEWFDHSRFLKNLAVQQHEDYWARNRVKPAEQQVLVTYNTQAGELVSLRNDPELAPFLKRVPAQVLQQALRDVDNAYQRFYKGEARKPTYYSKYKSKRSCRVPQGFKIERVSRKWARVRLPLIGWVKIKYHKALIGRAKSLTVNQDRAGAYYISCLIETNENGKPARVRRRKARKRLLTTQEQLQEGEPVNAIGVDLGVTVNTVLSSGEFIPLVSLTETERQKVKELQAREVGQAKGSNRRIKTRQQVNKLHKKAAQRRFNHAHQVSTYLIKNHDLVSVEALRVRNMSKSAKGTLEEPGKNVAQKRGLNRSIQEQAWGKFRELLEEKGERAGVIVMKVNPAYSSLTCSDCGFVSKDSRPSQSEFNCVSCENTMNADVNAARVILERGLQEATTQTQELPSNKNHSLKSGEARAVNHTREEVDNVNTPMVRGSKKLVSAKLNTSSKSPSTQSKISSPITELV